MFWQRYWFEHYLILRSRPFNILPDVIAKSMAFEAMRPAARAHCAVTLGDKIMHNTPNRDNMPSHPFL